MRSTLRFRACDLSELLYGVVEHLRQLCVRRAVVHLLAVPSAHDEAAALQEPEMMGDGRAAHIDDGGDIEYALLTVTQKPEDAQTARVAKLFHRF